MAIRQLASWTASFAMAGGALVAGEPLRPSEIPLPEAADVVTRDIVTRDIVTPDIVTPDIVTPDQVGEAIFRHNWARPDQWQGLRPLGEQGDGLGPVYNDVSCIACHSLGGDGGAGDNSRNVQFLSLDVIRLRSSTTRRDVLLQQLRELHPQLSFLNPTVMLHRYGFGPQDDTAEYDAWRENLLLPISSTDRNRSRADSATAGRIPLLLSERNTPALWGAGVIERLRRAGGEKLRRQISIRQTLRGNGVAGRIPRTANGDPGWFGWRGHIEHLPEFVLSACVNELGLAVNSRPQPLLPTDLVPARRKADGVSDLTNRQVVALTSFVGSLPRPHQVLPSDAHTLEQVRDGQKAFADIGCTVCHVPKFGFAEEIFTDFLLHDLGTSLSDPVAAFPGPQPRGTRRFSSGGYSGGSVPIVAPGSKASPEEPRSLGDLLVTREWRTPPLWGVADSAPYLHDGRAATLDDAIRLHAGEAHDAAAAYKSLPAETRSHLLTFLGTLRAPDAGAAVSREVAAGYTAN
jgi:CxxC motif-containing protein (DUF1111 family)